MAISPQHFEIIVIGGGPAGYQAAIRAAQLGQKTALVEGQHLGGICLNHGCIPTKTIKASVDLLLRIKQAKAYGLEAGDVKADLPAIIARKNKVVSLLKGSIAQLLQGYGVSVFEGWGHFVSKGQLEVRPGTEKEAIQLSADKFILATGSRPVLPRIFAPWQDKIMTTDEILNMSALPASLLIVGAGAIGVEMAFIMAGLGSSVTLIEALERILPKEDAEMSDYLVRMLKRQRVKVITGAAVQEVNYQDGFTLELANGQTLQGQALLVAAGRAPNLERLALENIGLDPQGYLKVNEQMETRVPGVYAAGDLSGGWLLAHVASAEGITAAENAAGLNNSLDYRVIPRCTFSMPEFAGVGLTEEEARAEYPVKTASFPFKGLGMAQAMGEWEGLVKLIVNEQTEEILGGHIIGPHASDLISEIALAMQHKITVSGLAETIHTHPTLAEAVQEAALAILGRAIHVLPGK